MRLQYDAGEEVAFRAGLEELVDRFEQATAGQVPTDAHDAVRTAGEFVWGYADGHLGRWTAERMDELLLDFYPRKVSGLDDAGIAAVVPGLHAYLDWLSRQRWLTADSDPLPLLHAALHSTGEEFAEAMRDPARFGPAKSLMAALVADGVDLDDQAAVDAWVTAFNERPFADRAALIPGPASERDSEPSYGRTPPVELPTPDVLDAQALASPLLQRLAAVAEFMGSKGRAVTKARNLRIADGRALHERLGFDERHVRGPLDEVRSSTQLGGVDDVYILGLELGLLEPAGSRVRAVPARVAALWDEPAAMWREALLMSLDAGVASQRYGDTFVPYWSERIDEAAVELLLDLCFEDRVDVSAVTDELLASLTELDPVTRDAVLKWVLSDLDRGLDVLEDAGAVVRDRPADLLRPTPLGRMAAIALLEQAGADVPILGALAGAGPVELLEVVRSWEPEAADAEAGRWAQARSYADVAGLAAELSGLEVELRPGLLLLFDALEERAEPLARTLLHDPDLRAYARAWLTDRGLLGNIDEDPEVLIVEHLAVMAATGGAHAAVAMLRERIPDASDCLAVVERFWRVDSPAAVEALEAIASAGDKRLAKTARKALFRLSSS